MGFANGRLLIFDIGAAVLAAEMRQHGGAVQDIAFDAAGARLYTAGEATAACSLAATGSSFASHRTLYWHTHRDIMSGACKPRTGAMASSAQQPDAVQLVGLSCQCG